MRHSTISAFVAVIIIYCISALPSIATAQEFEGTITTQMSSPMLGSQKIEMVSMVKGNKVLQTADDPKQGKMSIYTDGKTGTQIIVMESQKQGMEIDQDVIDAAIKSMHLPALIPNPTGTKKKIAGYNCELYTLAIDSSQEMDIWLTKDLPKEIVAALKNCTEAGMKSTGVKSDGLMSLFQNGYAQVKMEIKYNGVTQLTNESRNNKSHPGEEHNVICKADPHIISRFGPKYNQERIDE